MAGLKRCLFQIIRLKNQATFDLRGQKDGPSSRLPDLSEAITGE